MNSSSRSSNNKTMNSSTSKRRSQLQQNSLNELTSDFMIPVPTSFAVHNTNTDNKNVDLNDPDLLNNLDKLMRIQFDDEPLLQVANSPNFMDRMQYQTEMFLQDESLKKIAIEYQKIKLKSKDDQDQLIANMEGVLSKLEKSQEEALYIYGQAKNQPFWIPAETDQLDHVYKSKLQEWAHVMHKFSNTYKESIRLRFKRHSLAPKSSPQKENVGAEQFVQQLSFINQELGNVSKILDNL